MPKYVTPWEAISWIACRDFEKYADLETVPYCDEVLRKDVHAICEGRPLPDQVIQRLPELKRPANECAERENWIKECSATMTGGIEGWVRRLDSSACEVRKYQDAKRQMIEALSRGTLDMRGIEVGAADDIQSAIIPVGFWGYSISSECGQPNPYF